MNLSQRVKLLIVLFVAVLSFSFSCTNTVYASIQPTTDIQEGVLYEIVHVASGKVLDITDESHSNGATVQIWSSSPQHTNQLFLFEKDTLGWKIISFHSGKVVEVRNHSKTNGAAIAQWDDSMHLSQRWTVLDNDDGTVSFKNNNSDKVMDVQYGGTYDSCPLWLYERNNSEAQKFLLREYDAAKITSATWERDSKKYPFPAYNIGENCIIQNASNYGLSDSASPVLNTNFVTQLQYLNSNCIFNLLKEEAYRKSLGTEIKEILAEEGFEIASDFVFKNLGIHCPYFSTIVTIVNVLTGTDSNWNRFVTATEENKGIIIVVNTHFKLHEVSPRPSDTITALRSHPYSLPINWVAGMTKKYYQITSHHSYEFLVWDELSFNVDDVCFSQGTWHVELK